MANSYNINSQIFKFNGTAFVTLQSILTNVALDWEYFSVNNQSFLVVANSYNGTSYNIDSQIFKFDGTRFVAFQSISTNGAFDWKYFSMKDENYLAVANNNFDSQIFALSLCW